VVIWDVDWETISVHSADPERTRRMLRAWDEHLTHRALPQTLSARLRAAGFDDVAMESHAFATSEFTEDAYGVALLGVFSAFVATVEDFGPEEAAAWRQEQEVLGARGEFYFSITQACFTAARPA
jgi:hypothetical protein